MSKGINLKEAVRRNIIRDGDTICLEEFFQKDATEVVLTPQETGWDDEQIIPKEFLEWKIAKNRKGEPIILGGATVTQLILKGYTGLSKGAECINKISKIYSNPEIGLYPRGIQAEDDIIDQTEQKNPSWISTSYEDYYEGIKYYGLYHVYNNELRNSDLYNSDGYYYKESNRMIFIIDDSSLFEKLSVNPDSVDKLRVWNPTMSVETK